MRLIWIILLAVLVLPTPAQAQDLTIEQLLRAKSVRCRYGEGVTASWDEGKPKLERGAGGEGLIQTFDSIDLKKGQARLITRAGAGDVQVIANGIGISFVEYLPLGGFSITTVFFRRQVKTADQAFIAVLSKHVSIRGPFPSQWHGTCEVLQ